MKPNKYNYNNQSGMYRHKITLRKRITTEDEIGQQIPDYEDFGTYWAMIKTLKGSEIASMDQERKLIQDRFIVKYSSRLDEFLEDEKTSFELIYKNVTYDVIEAINDNYLNETITIVAKGRV